MSEHKQSYDRYRRQITLHELGETGQQRLLDAKVLMIGAGGLGCAVLPYLAAAGIGTIGLIDHDVVSLHNLHRQILFRNTDIGQSKAHCAAAVLKQLNPDININAFAARVSVHNALELIEDYDLIIDGTDNFSTRYLINDACVLSGKPLVYGAVSRFEGQVAIFNAKTHDNTIAVNYRDLFPDPPQPGEIANCEEAGVLGVLPGIIGTMQAAEAIKLIAGLGRPACNRLLTYNALTNDLYDLEIMPGNSKDAGMPKDREAFKEMNYDSFCGAVRIETIEADQFNEWRTRPGTVVIDVRQAGEQPVVTEFDHAHVPLEDVHAYIPPEEKDTIIVFCQSGQRSLRAAQLLTQKVGSSLRIASLAGGIIQWKAMQEANA